MNTPFFLSIQGSYSNLELALYQGSNCLELIKEANIKSSSLLIPLISQILKNNSKQISDLDFIAIDQGPGAFTSLRVTITTVNGLAFASKIPLIGIDGLDALSEEALEITTEKHEDFNPEILVTLLNAYNNDVFFDINKITDSNTLEPTEKINPKNGYKKIDLLLEEIKNNFPESKIVFVGNGTRLHQNAIAKTFEDNILIIDKEVCSAATVARIALETWNQISRDTEKKEYKLSPLYLKSQSFAIRPKKN